MSVLPTDDPYHDDAGPQKSPDAPVLLDYFAAHEPQRRQTRTVTVWSVILLLGWAPYVCGIVNTMAIVHSASAAAIASHHSGAAIFMALGVLASVASLTKFIRLRHLTGSAAAGTVLLLQLSVAACIGLGR